MSIRINSTVIVISFQILFVFGLWIYFKSTYGVYKHKYIKELETRKKEFKERLNALEKEQVKKQDTIKLKIRKLKSDVIKSRIILKKINAKIDNSIVTDNELELFLSRFPDAPEPP